MKPRDKKAKLHDKTIQIFRRICMKKEVQFPAEGNTSAIVHQHGRRDFSYKPAIRSKLIRFQKETAGHMYVDKESDFRKMEGKNISVFKYQQISVERTKIIIKLTWHDNKS